MSHIFVQKQNKRFDLHKVGTTQMLFMDKNLETAKKIKENITKTESKPDISNISDEDRINMVRATSVEENKLAGDLSFTIFSDNTFKYVTSNQKMEQKQTT